MTRLQCSLHATARVLAPSKEALDAPLSPPPLNDEPGPATGHSGVYPDGTSTCTPGPASRTQHASHRRSHPPAAVSPSWLAPPFLAARRRTHYVPPPGGHRPCAPDRNPGPASQRHL